MVSRQPVRSASVWRAADVVDTSQWCTHLTSSQQHAVVEAANHALEIGRTPATIERNDFDLPGLRPTVIQWVETLNEGRGFILLRGFPVNEHTSVIGAFWEPAASRLRRRLPAPASTPAGGRPGTG